MGSTRTSEFCSSNKSLSLVLLLSLSNYSFSEFSAAGALTTAMALASNVGISPSTEMSSGSCGVNGNSASVNCLINSRRYFTSEVKITQNKPLSSESTVRICQKNHTPKRVVV